MVKKLKRLLYAKQTDKLGVVPYYTSNNKKKTSNYCVLQENHNNHPQTNKCEDLENRNVRTILEMFLPNREIRNHNLKQPQATNFIRRGNVKCKRQTVRF